MKTFAIAFLGLVFVSSAAIAQAPDVGRARQQGVSDGNGDGAREGRERGPVDGKKDGQIIGYRDGYNTCSEQERKRQYDVAYDRGYREGQPNGERDGYSQGRSQGRRDGDREGRIDGENRADRDAYRDATPEGRRKGIEEANQSDASRRGEMDGLRDGDIAALEKAKRIDYPRGRQDYSDERWAEPILNYDEFSQTLPEDLSHELVAQDLQTDPNQGVIPSPDRRYYRPRRTYPTAQENQAYKSGYASGYSSGFRSSYQGSYNNAYRSAYNSYYNQGCQEGRNRDFPEARRQGYQAGYDRGYQQAYRLYYDRAYQQFYDQEFRRSSDQAYRDTYPRAYDRHFENARASAYRERYQELYKEAYDYHYDQELGRRYPIYAQQQYDLGRRDEAEEFRLKPIRMIELSLSETIMNGLYEPGEPLHFQFIVRNFSSSELSARDVVLQAQSPNSRLAIISQTEASSAQRIRAKSLTTIKKALGVTLTEDAVKTAARLSGKILYQGRAYRSKDITQKARFILDIGLEGSPYLSEGLPTDLEFKFTNLSTAPLDAATQLEFTSDPSKMEIINGSGMLPALRPGESTTVKFEVIGRSSQQVLDVPLSLSSLSLGRRIGWLNANASLPVRNDYQIKLRNAIDGLRSPGVTRAKYRIKNISSRESHRSLQLFIRVQADRPSDFDIIGPNPQYLRPVKKGKQTEFVIPIRAAQSNTGGTVELEVHEAGRAVVIHREKF